MNRFAILICLFGSPAAAAATCSVPEGAGEPINHARLYIEDNAGDGDLGVHGYFDDDGWQELCVFDPSGALVLHVTPEGRMAGLGVAGVFFESREPAYAEWGYDALKAGWPEGQYAVRALTHEGTLLTGAATFTTVLPTMPVIVQPATVPEKEGEPLPTVPVADLTVEWMPVTASQDGRPIVITAYQVTVEKQNHDDPNGSSRPDISMHVGPGLTSVVVPKYIFDPASIYEIEVLALEESGNQTIGGASFFATE